LSSPVVARLRAEFPGAVDARPARDGDVAVDVALAALPAVMPFVRNEAELAFDALLDLFAVDLLPESPRFEVVYRWTSRARGEVLRVHTRIDAEDPTLPSVTSLWPSAAWMEREAFDLVGVRFEGHPELRRILQEPDAEGFPLRRDAPMAGSR